MVFDVSTRNLHDSGRKFDLLHDLHLLWINSRLTFKLATLRYKGHHFGHPGYIFDLLHIYKHRQGHFDLHHLTN